MASIARDIRFDPARLVHEDGRPKQLYELDPDTRLALRGFKMEPVKRRAGKGRQVIGYNVEWKFPEKLRSRRASRP